MLLVPEEGWRRHSRYWKSGCYHIAFEAEVPILPTFFEYNHIVGGFGLPLSASGEFRNDMQTLRDFTDHFLENILGILGPVNYVKRMFSLLSISLSEFWDPT